jgi:hypothetical protein
MFCSFAKEKKQAVMIDTIPKRLTYVIIFFISQM